MGIIKSGGVSLNPSSKVKEKKVHTNQDDVRKAFFACRVFVEEVI